MNPLFHNLFQCCNLLHNRNQMEIQLKNLVPGIHVAGKKSSTSNFDDFDDSLGFDNFDDFVDFDDFDDFDDFGDSDDSDDFDDFNDSDDLFAIAY